MVYKRLLGVALLLAVANVLFGTAVCMARTEPLYEYVKVEEYSPNNFPLALIPETAFPIETIIKYEKRLNADITIEMGEGEKKVRRRLQRGGLFGVEYRARYRDKRGEPFEALLYSIDYTETDRGIKTNLVSPSWINGYKYIRNNTEKDALIICWWTHSRQIEMFTGRETLVLGPSLELLDQMPVEGDRYKQATRRYEQQRLRKKVGLDNNEKLKDVARMFCSPEPKALEIMQKYNPTGRPLYVVIGVEEFLDLEGINRLAGGDLKIQKNYVQSITTTVEKDMVLLTQWLKTKGRESFYVQIFEEYYTLWYVDDRDDPSMQDALLLRLLPLSTGHGQEIGYFKPVFQSPEAHVWVYRFMPEGIPVRRIGRAGARHGGDFGAR